MKHEHLKSSISPREKKPDPFEVINNFFSAAEIHSHRKYIKAALKAASSGSVWKKGDPGLLVHEFKLLESLINAAYLLKPDKISMPAPADDDFSPQLFVDPPCQLKSWNRLPKFLSFKEYLHPEVVFARFFKFQTIDKWKQQLDEILEHALLKTSMADSGIELNPLNSCIHLIKLVEAAHILNMKRTKT